MNIPHLGDQKVEYASYNDKQLPIKFPDQSMVRNILISKKKFVHIYNLSQHSDKRLTQNLRI